MSYLNRLPITSPTFWDLTVVISRLSILEQEALLAAIQVLQHRQQTGPTWRKAHTLTLVARQKEAP